MIHVLSPFLSPTHMHPHAYICTHMHTCAHTHSLSLPFSLSRALLLSATNSYTHTHTCSNTRSLSLSLSNTHTHKRTPTRILTHTHTHTCAHKCTRMNTHTQTHRLMRTHASFILWIFTIKRKSQDRTSETETEETEKIERQKIWNGNREKKENMRTHASFNMKDACVRMFSFFSLSLFPCPRSLSRALSRSLCPFPPSLYPCWQECKDGGARAWACTNKTSSQLDDT